MTEDSDKDAIKVWIIIGIVVIFLFVFGIWIYLEAVDDGFLPAGFLSEVFNSGV